MKPKTVIITEHEDIDRFDRVAPRHVSRAPTYAECMKARAPRLGRFRDRDLTTVERADKLIWLAELRARREEMRRRAIQAEAERHPNQDAE